MSENFSFVFPGQGSQSVGMLADMAESFPSVLETFKTASDVLGYDLWAIAQEGPAEKLSLTEITQPLLLVSSVAIWTIWNNNYSADTNSKSLPKLMAGHSLGEYSALVCSGVIDFKDAVLLVQQRGKFMQEAVPVGTGAMAAVVGLEDAVIESVCNEMTEENAVVEPANYNSPGQVVIAGHKATVEAASDKLKQAGAKMVAQLPVSAPFHTTLMKPAADRLLTIINNLEFSEPKIPVIHNVDALVADSIDEIKEKLYKQTFSPVKWTQCVEAMISQGIEQTFECGAGKVLSGLNRRIQKSLKVVALEKPEAIKESLS